MKKILFATLALAATGSSQAQAQEMGRVISATPVMQQVGVPRQVCGTETVAVQPPKSGAGAAIGAIAGGAIGNSVGGGAGQAAATMIGIVGGAVLGDRIEGAPPAQAHNVQRCTLQTFYENRATSYNVVYEYGGKQYSVQLPNDPGPTLQLQVTPVGAPPQNAAAAVAQVQASPVYAPAPAAVVAAPSYPVYYPAPYPAAYPAPYYGPYIPPVQLRFGYWGGWGGHRHWR